MTQFLILQAWASTSADGCCRCKACLHNNVYILLHVPLSGNVFPANVNASMIVRGSMILRSENIANVPWQMVML